MTLVSKFSDSSSGASGNLDIVMMNRDGGMYGNINISLKMFRVLSEIQRNIQMDSTGNWKQL